MKAKKADIINNYKSGKFRTLRFETPPKLITTVANKRDGGGDTQTLQLKIATNSWSPVMTDGWRDHYREQISASAFDESLTAVKRGEKVVYSFADHEMSTNKIISSTKRASTKLFKDANQDIIIEMEMHADNHLHRLIMDLVANGDITANSFIFRAEEVEITEFEDDNREVDYQVVIKKGDLISIDPVVFAFYPQNAMVLKGGEKMKIKNPKTDADFNNEEVAVEQRNDKKENKKDGAANQNPPNPKPPKAKPEEKDKEPEQTEAGKQVEQAAADQGLKALSEAEVRAASIAAMLKSLGGNNNLAATSKRETQLFLEYRQTGFCTLNDTDKEAITKMIAKQNKEFIRKNLIDSQELALFNYQMRALTGADSDNGALIISVATDPNVVGQDVVTMPEFDGVRRIPMSGLEEKKVPVDVDTFSVASEKAEGADSDTDTTTVVKAQFKPTRYAIDFSYNPLLQTHAGVVQQKTTNISNKIRRAWKKFFYDNLLPHKGSTFANVKNTYRGGLTSDAMMNGPAANAGVKQEHLDLMILKIADQYGTIEEGAYRFYMKKETWTSVYEDARSNGNDALIRVVKGKRMYGPIQVITSDYYTDTMTTRNNIAVVLAKKSSVVVYGGVMIQKDSIEQGFKKELSTRLISGRGQAKHCDPFYTSVGLKIT